MMSLPAMYFGGRFCFSGKDGTGGGGRPQTHVCVWAQL